MSDTQKRVEITVSINESAYDVLKAAAPLIGGNEVTPEILAAGYIEDKVQQICNNIHSSKEKTK